MITPLDLDAFLAAYIANNYNFSAACLVVGKDRRSMQRYFDRNPAAAERLADAKATMRDNLEAEAFRRAMNGIAEGSTTALMKMLAAHAPEYRDKSTIDHTNSDGSLKLTDVQIAARVASITTSVERRIARGEVIEAEFTDAPPALAQAKLEDLL